MFDQLKGMASLAGLMKDLPKIKEKMEAVKERLAEVSVSAETAGGAVRATANGHLRITSLEIEPALLSGLIESTEAEDRAMAADLVVGAVNAALEKAREAAGEEVKRAADELGLPIPAGGIENLMP